MRNFEVFGMKPTTSAAGPAFLDEAIKIVPVRAVFHLETAAKLLKLLERIFGPFFQTPVEIIG